MSIESQKPIKMHCGGKVFSDSQGNIIWDELPTDGGREFVAQRQKEFDPKSLAEEKGRKYDK